MWLVFVLFGFLSFVVFVVVVVWVGGFFVVVGLGWVEVFLFLVCFLQTIAGLPRA